MIPLRIAFAGASGSGKTTMVKYIHEKYNIPWLNGSSGGLKSEEAKEDLERRGVEQGKGHAAVIRTGHINPIVAGDNQVAILSGRLGLLSTEGSFVTDRSPIDNIVYMEMQCAMYESEEWCRKFINRAIEGMNLITHLIYCTPLGFVEDNGSRIANRYYQEAVDAVFSKAIAYHVPHQVRLLTLGHMGIPHRKEKINSFLPKVTI